MPAKTSDRPRIFLNNVHLKGFKSIEDLSVDFQKGLNILIGKNGSGKSNIMEFLFEAIEVNRYNKFLHKYAKVEFVSEDGHSIVLELEKDLSVKIDKEAPEDGSEVHEKIVVDNKVVANNFDDRNYGQFEFKNKKVSYRGNPRNLLINLGYQYAHPLFIKFNLPDNLDCIAVPVILSASNVGTVVNWAYPKTVQFIDDIFWEIENTFSKTQDIEQDISKENISEHLKIANEIIENLKLYSSIEDVRFNPNLILYTIDKPIFNEKSITIENVKIEFKINGNWLPWSQLSDGTKRLFYIIAAITNTTGLVLIEEPELGIHPHQFNLLMDFLKEQSENKQIILSTHSPKALDHLSQDELNSILVTYYDLKKGTQIRHLTGKEIAKAKKYMKEVGFFSDYWLLSDLEE
ncbi:MAG: AAA family ATPase [Sphingobacteriales bacterium]